MHRAPEQIADAPAHAPLNPDGAGRQRLMVFRVGTSLCAVPLDHVVEVMRALPIKPVTGGPNIILGLCIVRGEAIAVADVGLLIGSEATECRRLITVRTGERTIALAASDVLGVQSIAVSELKDLPPLLDAAGNDSIAAIGTVDAELLFLLSAARVIAPELIDQLVADGAKR